MLTGVESFEVRWFEEGAMPLATRHWFEQLPGDIVEEKRPDYYSASYDSGDLGLKLRDGEQFEIKRRQARRAAHQFTDRVGGYPESWIKWSFGLAEVPRLPSEDDPNWATVTKVRWKRKWAVNPDGTTGPIDPDTRASGAASLIELTTLSCRNEAWWTFAFEALPATESPLDVLMVVSRSLLAGGRSPTFSAADSYGYPHWLLSRGRRRRKRPINRGGQQGHL